MKFFCHWLLTGLILVAQSVCGQENAVPNRELRGVWVATVFSLDWPKTTGVAAQKNELINILDKARETNLNAIFLQIRTECDALYNSNHEPWSRYLTGAQGQDPGYDPLAFAIEEAHKRGLELHAWMNPFRVNASTNPSQVYSNDHISQTHPEWMLEFSTGQKILNPALPETRSYIASVVVDVVGNYNVDGIHFDDYFYPYPGSGFPGITNEDADDFAMYGGGFTDIGDWRRHNINQTVQLVQDEIKKVNPALRFGISPFGIWKNGVPAGITGLDAYNVIYADATHWLQNGSVDYVAPQLYWPIGGSQDFRKLLEWWAGQAFDASRHIYAGHTLKDITSSSGRNGRSIAMLENALGDQKGKDSFYRTKQSVDEVPNQIAIVRENETKNALGSIFFRVADLMANPAGFTDYIKEEVYPYPAAPPAMGWLPGDPPAAPTGLVYQTDEASGNVILQWERGTGNAHNFKRYIVYRLPDASGQVPAEGAIYDITVSEQTEVAYKDLPAGQSWWAIAELGPTNQSSALSNIISIEKVIELPQVPVIMLPAEQVSSSDQTFIRFEWAEQPGIVSYHYQLATNADFISPIEDDSQLDGSTTARLFTNLEDGKYYFRIKASNEGGSSDWSPTFTVTLGSPVTGIENSEYIDHLHLYPNPSSKGVVYITLNLKRSASVSFDVVSLAGKRALSQPVGFYNRGEHRIELDCHALAKGFYMIRLSVNQSHYTKRLILN